MSPPSKASQPRFFALIVAAGRGSRFGGVQPKQYANLAGVSILRRTIDAFLQHPAEIDVHVVIHADDRELYAAAVEGLRLPPPETGGATRQASVLRGLERLDAAAQDIVLIHDAARPLIEPEIIDRCIAALDAEAAAGAIAAIPVCDTIKRAGSDGKGAIIDATIDRRGLWRAQTPQAFRHGAILTAHRAAAGLELTDDAAVAEYAGLEVALVQGSENNFKITTADDLLRAERFLKSGAKEIATEEMRCGSGFDVHAFVAGDHVWLNGIRIAHDHGLLGHSDADAGLHALTDAILGAISAGDIGDHFPPTDPRWRGAASDRFLAHARDLVRARGGRIVHCDVTLICERPKIGPHRKAMVARIAEILEIDAGRVSVKATTTEGLGFTGRREGIAAQAVATVALPAGS